MGYFDYFLNFLISPAGIILAVTGGILLAISLKNYTLRWLLFSLCCFASSLAEYQDPFVEEIPALAFPLQQIRTLGRPLTYLLLILLCGLAFNSVRGNRISLMPRAFFFIIILQVLVVFKTIIYGNIFFAFLTILLFGVVIYMMVNGPSRWIQTEEDARKAIWSIAIVGVIFIIANSYQAYIDWLPITFTQGRFLGTTGNPQHAAVLLAATIPAINYQFEKYLGLEKWFWLITLVLSLYGLYLTGSRTGMLIALLALIIYYRRRIRNLLLWILLIIPLSSIIINETFITEESVGSETLTERYLNVEDTRTMVWEAQARAFNQYPVFGAPLKGERFRYGENSWLAVAASFGILGLIPLVIFGWLCLQMMLKLNKLSQLDPKHLRLYQLVISGLFSLLVGSYLEAYLLGNITFPLLCIFLYLIIGNFLIEKYTKRT